MPLTKPALATADPGRPITAQAWNALVSAINDLYDAVNALGGNALAVTVSAAGSPRPDARVVAVPSGGGRAIPAIAPFAGQTAHQLAGLTDGAWQILVSAAGCADASVDVTVPAATTATVTLTLNQQLMPDLFGQLAPQALAALAAKTLTIDAIFDTGGNAVAKTTLPANYETAAVVWQFPAPGAFAAASAGQVRLVLGTELQSALVTVPSLTGLTLAEATKALTDLGLKVGTTVIT
jgi:hypothetical protein